MDARNTGRVGIEAVRLMAGVRAPGLGQPPSTYAGPKAYLGNAAPEEPVPGAQDRDLFTPDEVGALLEQMGVVRATPTAPAAAPSRVSGWLPAVLAIGALALLGRGE